MCRIASALISPLTVPSVALKNTILTLYSVAKAMASVLYLVYAAVCKGMAYRSYMSSWGSVNDQGDVSKKSRELRAAVDVLEGALHGARACCKEVGDIFSLMSCEKIDGHLLDQMDFSSSAYHQCEFHFEDDVDLIQSTEQSGVMDRAGEKVHRALSHHYSRELLQDLSSVWNKVSEGFQSVQSSSLFKTKADDGEGNSSLPSVTGCNLGTSYGKK